MKQLPAICMRREITLIYLMYYHIKITTLQTVKTTVLHDLAIIPLTKL